MFSMAFLSFKRRRPMFSPINRRYPDYLQVLPSMQEGMAELLEFSQGNIFSSSVSILVSLKLL